jgi:hypothetical protein
MKRMMLISLALAALAGCATGQGYTAVEAGPSGLTR